MASRSFAKAFPRFRPSSHGFLVSIIAHKGGLLCCLSVGEPVLKHLFRGERQAVDIDAWLLVIVRQSRAYSFPSHSELFADDGGNFLPEARGILQQPLD